MKHLLYLICLFSGYIALAQPCTQPQSSIDLEVNNIRARILNGGDLFTNFNEGVFQPVAPPGGVSPTSIYAAGLWIGGFDPGINLKLARTDYRGGTLKGDFTAGPLNPNTGTTTNGDCANWDRHFIVKGSEIADFLNNPPANANELKQKFPSLAGWPARGNPHFLNSWGFELPSTTQELAGFYDANGDGIYNPLNGDYPVIQLQGKAPFVADAMIFCVFNDQGSAHSSGGDALQVEVQQNAWAFNCSDNIPVSNTIFVSHKIINRATEDADSCFIGLWVDIDLGCYTDDYAGCNTALNAMYAYNQDAQDGSVGLACDGGVTTFGDNPPAQSVTFLNRSLDKFMVFNPFAPEISPLNSNPLPYYNCLAGAWPDGEPLTDAPSGYGPGNPVSHLFPDDPSDPNGWSMCTSNALTGDIRILGSNKLERLSPGEITELTTAWTLHQDTDLPCGLGNTFDEIAQLRTHFNNGFGDICSPLGAKILPDAAIQVSPNPSQGEILVKHADLNVQLLRLFNSAGQLVLESAPNGKEQSVLSLVGLTPGIYNLQVQGAEGVAVRKVVFVP